jgi:type IV fimbrial biogenesis protein FimT
MRRGERGITLIELLIAMVVLATLLGIGIPQFRDAVVGARLRTMANELYTSVQLARGEAIKRNTVVSLCASSDGSTCSGTWHDGWVVRTSTTVIHVAGALPDEFRVTRTSGTGTSLSFYPIGVGATTAAFRVCRHSPVGKQERVVTIDATGNAYVTTTENGVCP